MSPRTIVILSDVHYAGTAERTRPDFELKLIPNVVTRFLLRLYRRFIWLDRPLEQNHLLEQFLAAAPMADLVIGNGDYTADTGFVGVKDEAGRASAQECLGKLRGKFGTRFRALMGDHELGKFSMIGQHGGLSLESWHRCVTELKLQPLWQEKWGVYRLIAVTSSLLTFSILERESIPAERVEWRQLREKHLTEIRQIFETIKPGEKILLFCHDPSALPFLAEEPLVSGVLGQVEMTVVGHLHSPFILWQSSWLAGMPPITWLGNTIRRMSTALRRARAWKRFKVRLCPSLAGIELFKDGGFLSVIIDEDGGVPARLIRHKIKR